MPVYVVKSWAPSLKSGTGGWVVKIGFSKDRAKLMSRLMAMQSDTPDPLDILWIKEDATEAEETRLHAMFHGEWHRGEYFVLTEELDRFVRSQAKADEGSAKLIRDFRERVTRRFRKPTREQLTDGAVALNSWRLEHSEREALDQLVLDEDR